MSSASRNLSDLRATTTVAGRGAEAVLPLLADPTVFDHNRPSAEHPLTHRNLGEVYEALGEYDRAREAYEYFVEHWRDADPMVAEAREAITRLTRLQSE